ncbi:MAG: hypothetical protein K2Z81_09135, partial [Cyanobacteria bacterium]|nr:hypothetical protein [Cyanobacteriota bacterium]
RLVRRLASTGFSREQLQGWFPQVRFGEVRPATPGGTDQQRPPTDQQRPPTDQANQGLNSPVFARLARQHQENTAPLRSLPQNPTIAQIDTAFDTAIRNAGRVDRNDITQAMGILRGMATPTVEARNRGEMNDEQVRQTLAPVLDKWQEVGQIANADGYLWISRGMLKMRIDNANPDRGVADVRQGFQLHPELAQDPGVIQRLQATNFTDQQLRTWFPTVNFPPRQTVQPASDRR